MNPDSTLVVFHRCKGSGFFGGNGRVFVDYLNKKPAEKDEIEILSMNVKENSLKFTFLYKDEESGETSWNDNWKQNTIPSGVRIEMDFLNPEKEGQRLTYVKDVLIPHGIYGEEEML